MSRSPNCDRKLDRTVIGANELNTDDHDRVIDNEDTSSEPCRAILGPQCSDLRVLCVMYEY